VHENSGIRELLRKNNGGNQIFLKEGLEEEYPGKSSVVLVPVRVELVKVETWGDSG
jgi:hypothetical protein